MDKLMCSYGCSDVIPAIDDTTVLTVQPESVVQDSDMDGNCDVSVGVESNTSADESRRLSIERSIRSLVHASDCRHTDCAMPSCYKMKRIIHHAKGCKIKPNQLSGNNSDQTTDICLVCKQLIALCCYHAKHCRQNKCPVPYCLKIKLKLRTQQLHQRLREVHTLNRRIALMASMCRNSSQTCVSRTTVSITSSTATPPASAQIDAILMSAGLRRAQYPPILFNVI